ncbi:C40 family peptidase [Catenulispora rubra]|uniref:C40 family peptidase n=1 Tax=Catenulispora rubra TaxID=280293 RepID=UPI00189273DD|nr:C40 family peptidase [Catenulispora rubra]
MTLLSAAAAAVVESMASSLDVFSVSSNSRGGHIPDADGDIPLRMYELYHDAAATCSGLSWTVLAGLGKIASDHGRHPTDQGLMGITTSQFQQHADPIPAGGVSPASPLDPVDQVYAAARTICASGPATDLTAVVRRATANPASAVRIVELADVYSRASSGNSFIAVAARSAPSAAARLALEYAGAHLGLPYVWGGDGPDRGGVGFDCSGLTQSAYQAAGIAIPRTATDQFKTGRPVTRADLRAGDLVFYGDPNGFLHHVAMYVRAGLVIDAPHPGAVVRLDPVAADDYAGARRES